MDYFTNSPCEIEIPITSLGQLRAAGLAGPFRGWEPGENLHSHLGFHRRKQLAHIIFIHSGDVDEPRSRHLSVCCSSEMQRFLRPQRPLKMNWVRWHQEGS